MKNNKNISIILLVLLCAQVLISHTFFTYAVVSNVDVEFYIDSIANSNIDTNLKPSISAPIVDIDIPVRVSFDNTNVVSYSIETEGLTATEVTDNSMEFDVVATEEFGVLDVYD